MYAALTAGALEAFAVDLQSAVYKRATGALEVFAVDLQLAVYKRAAGDLEVFTASPFAYKQPTATPLDYV
ncbi:hypothetical protein BRD22_01025 [Halobacteriales archaeon SW_8_68_21]|nr:MAG: hypothetical protein BRD22_01025 [Halobacteriales archaeon SW_8_68_21]